MEKVFGVLKEELKILNFEIFVTIFLKEKKIIQQVFVFCCCCCFNFFVCLFSVNIYMKSFRIESIFLRTKSLGLHVGLIY